MTECDGRKGGTMEINLSDKELDTIAEAITERLFTNGRGEKARRLVLELEDGQDGGGWGRRPAFEQIRDALQKSLS